MHHFFSKFSIFLFISYVAFCFYRAPQFADALIVLFLGLVYVVQFHLPYYFQKPEPAKEKVEDPELAKMRAEIEKMRLEREMNAMNLDLAKLRKHINQANSYDQKTSPFGF